MHEVITVRSDDGK